MKIVINIECGGFGLSEKAVRRLAELKGATVIEPKLDLWYNKAAAWAYVEMELPDGQLLSVENVSRNDKDLIAVVEELGGKASGATAELGIIKIPDDVDWTIDDYDGTEWVAEKHRTWHYKKP